MGERIVRDAITAHSTSRSSPLARFPGFAVAYHDP